MLLKISEQLDINASPDELWKLLRDTPRLTALLPGVQEVSPLPEPGAEAYNAKATDKIGPFKVALNLQIRVSDAREASQLKASIKGADAVGLNRMSGSLHIMLTPALPAATQMRFEAEIEILGKLATLGAALIRRRTTEKFAEFARNIQAQFAAAPELRAGSRAPSNGNQATKDRR
jgi:carbon monoxide dehydrogenase subunit G